MTWRSVKLIRRSATAAKVAAAIVLVEQLAEVLLFHIALAEHPALVIFALGALGFPIPTKPETEEPA